MKREDLVRRIRLKHYGRKYRVACPACGFACGDFYHESNALVLAQRHIDSYHTFRDQLRIAINQANEV